MILAARCGGMGLVRLRIIARNVAMDARKFCDERNSWKMFGKPLKAPKGRRYNSLWQRHRNGIALFH
jgi:hypothetical protein